jgi:psiF repeat
MKKFASLLALTFAAIAMPAMAAEPTAQQNKMKTCNADAKTKNLAGDERKAFMKTCLSAKAEAPADGKTAQQNKMKTCNADAKTKDLKGDERKAFMSSCLKG